MLKRLLVGTRRMVADNRTASVFGVVVVGVAVAIGLLIGLSPFIMVALAGSVIAGTAAVLRWRRARTVNGRGEGVGAVAGAYVGMVLLVFAAIQIVPYGRDHANPVVAGEPDWDSPATRDAMVNACYGCHSNEVEWPWYSNIAPVSWAVTSHVASGRGKVNYSDFTREPGDASKTIETIEDGSMPPRYFTAFGLHPEANLSDAERAQLVAGLRATPGMSEDE